MRFPNIEGLIKEFVTRSERPEEIKRIREESRDWVTGAEIPSALAASEKKAVFRVRIPPIGPILFARLEAGMYSLPGMGLHKIPFETGFSDTPHLLKTHFGYYELSIPIPSVSITYRHIDWVDIPIPVISITKLTIKLPLPCFLLDVKPSDFTVLTGPGTTHLTYFAIGV